MKKLIISACIAVLILSGTAIADETEQSPEIQQLQKTVDEQNQLISELLDRIEAIEVQQEELEPLPASDEGGVPSWVQKIKFSGDLRTRYEYIDDDRKDDDRNRARIRARLKLKAKVNDEVDAVLRLSTSEANDEGEGDPVSGNQTLTHAWSLKEIWVSQAYFDYHPEMVEGLNILGGKVGMPFIVPVKSELIWDGDINPEGGVLAYHRDIEPVELFTNLYGFYTMENKADADPALFGGQAAVKFNFDAFDNGAHAMVGAGYFDFTHLEGEPALVDGDLFGNTEDPLVADAFEEDFNLINIFGEVGVKVQEIPITIFGDYVQNDEASSQDTGYSFGVAIGKAKDPGSWAFRYLYKEVEQNAVVGCFTDSDFGGGGTDVQGHEFNFTYQLAKNWSLGLSYFMNDVDVEAKPEEDYQRVQVDLGFKF